MQEIYLQEFWNLKILEGKKLRTECGKSLIIRDSGQWNHYGGPDFLFAHITLEGLDWFGHIEIHQNTTDWIKHQHDKDPNYGLVILHVVQHHDWKITNGVGNQIATLQLEGLKEFEKYSRREKKHHVASALFCGQSIMHHQDEMRTLLLHSAQQRLEQKAAYAFKLYQECRSSWLDVIYILIARAMGQQANADTMEAMAKSAPYRIWFRLHNDFDALQSLFMGLAGFDTEGQEFEFLSRKYSVSPLHDFQWNIGKVRPSALPFNRVRQLVALLHRYGDKLNELHIPDNPNHSFLNEDLIYNGENFSLSSVMADGIIINAIAPYAFARGKTEGDSSRMDGAMQLLSQIRPENNRITKYWLRCGFVAESAAETQGMLYLHRTLCGAARCEHCRFHQALHEHTEKSFP
jgi:hypothetical protein